MNIAAFQPFEYYQLGQGWYLRSAAVYTYHVEAGGYAVPRCLGLGKITRAEFSVVIAFVEPQCTGADDGDGQPEWGIFAGLNFLF